jgi:hypothetical protein
LFARGSRFGCPKVLSKKQPVFIVDSSIVEPDHVGAFFFSRDPGILWAINFLGYPLVEAFGNSAAISRKSEFGIVSPVDLSQGVSIESS